jgi:hypothetical protein
MFLASALICESGDSRQMALSGDDSLSARLTKSIDEGDCDFSKTRLKAIQRPIEDIHISIYSQREKSRQVEAQEKV